MKKVLVLLTASNVIILGFYHLKQNVGAKCYKCSAIVYPDEVDVHEEEDGESEEDSYEEDDDYDSKEEEYDSEDSEEEEYYSQESEEEEHDSEEDYDSDDSDEVLIGIGPFLGRYQCLKCDNDWISSHSWNDTYQKCKFGMKQIFAHQQV